MIRLHGSKALQGDIVGESPLLYTVKIDDPQALALLLQEPHGPKLLKDQGVLDRLIICSANEGSAKLINLLCDKGLIDPSSQVAKRALAIAKFRITKREPELERQALISAHKEIGPNGNSELINKRAAGVK